MVPVPLGLVLHTGMIASSALMIWKVLMVVTYNKSLIVMKQINYYRYPLLSLKGIVSRDGVSTEAFGV
jgi:hypothetical protein